MMEFELDFSELKDAIDTALEEVEDGVVDALDSIKDDWVAEARDIAPLDSGNLRKQIKGKVDDEGLNSEVIITANATNKSKDGSRFNYAYYIHEHDAGGNKLRTSGTQKRFLEKSVDIEKWQKYLVNRVMGKLRGKGWERE